MIRMTPIAPTTEPNEYQSETIAPLQPASNNDIGVSMSQLFQSQHTYMADEHAHDTVLGMY